MDSIHAAQLQQQLRHNANEVQEFVKELGEWEDEIKQKDESLKKNKPILKQVFFFFLVDWPAIFFILFIISMLLETAAY